MYDLYDEPSTIAWMIAGGRTGEPDDARHRTHLVALHAGDRSRRALRERVAAIASAAIVGWRAPAPTTTDRCPA